MKPLRILHLLATHLYSGPAQSVITLAEQQRALGHDVHIAIDRKCHTLDSESLLLDELQGHPCLSPLPLHLSPKALPWESLQDIRHLRRLTLDVLHAHTTHGHWLMSLSRPRGAALVRSFHTPRALSRWLPEVNGYTTYDSASLQSWRALHPGRRALELPALIGDAYRPADDRAALRRALQLPTGALIGMASTFQASRHHDVALTAFAALLKSQPHAHLVLIGDGATQEETRRLAQQLGIAQRVIFTGYLRGQAFIQALQALDALWILGLGNDYAARLAAQARLCGVYTLGVRAGAIPRYAHGLIDTLEPLALSQLTLAWLTQPQSAAPMISDERAAVMQLLDFYTTLAAA